MGSPSSGHLADVVALAPEALLLLGALGALVGGSFTPRTRQGRVRAGGAVVVVLALVATGLGVAGVLPAGPVFSGTAVVDPLTGAARLVVLGSLLLLLALAGHEVSGHARESEVVVLLLLSATGVLLLAAATDLALVVVAFLLAGLPLHGLLGVVARPGSAEATVKAYLFGAVLGVLMMLGAALLYGLAGATGYAVLDRLAAPAVPGAVVAAGVVLLLAGLLFEAGAVPAHFWVPDAVAGTTTTASAYLTTVPKVGAVVAVARLLEALPDPARWTALVGALAVLSMTLGNLAALTQRSVRRLLAWSTVSQVGYLLAVAAVVRGDDLARPALGLFLAAYAATNLACFAVVAAEPHRPVVADWRGAGRARPALVTALAVGLLGLVGTPPTGVFVAKLAAVAATWGAGAWWLAVALLLNTVLSLAYYLRWLTPCLRGAAVPAGGTAEGTRGPAAVAGVAAVLAVALGLLAGPVLALS